MAAYRIIDASAAELERRGECLGAAFSERDGGRALGAPASCRQLGLPAGGNSPAGCRRSQPCRDNGIAPRLNSVLSNRVHLTLPMQTTSFVRSFFLGCALASVPLLCAQTPPAGFTALFNGKDLAGWRGGDTFDHRKYLGMPEDKRAEQDAQWTADMTKHWRAEDNEFVNDGHGRYATTTKDYGDFELLIDYKTVPTADSGIYLRG